MKKDELYREFMPGDYAMLFKRLVSGETSFAVPRKGCGFDIPKLESAEKDNEFCLAVFPIHDAEAKDALYNKWMPMDWPWKLPLTAIKDYLGDEMAFYFAFLGSIATGLMFIAPVAVAIQLISWVNAGHYKGAMHAEAIFAVLMVCALSFVLDLYKSDQSKLAHLWEVYGCRKSFPPRPGFNGIVLIDPKSGHLTIDFPREMRTQRARVSIMTILTCTVVLFATVVSIFTYRAALQRRGASDIMMLIPAFINSIQIIVFGIIYQRIAVWMTNYENHRSQLEHNSSLFTKLTSFYFINYFASLFYIAFIKTSVEPQGCTEPLSGSTYCGRELSVQVIMVFFVNDFFNRLTNSVILPFFMRMMKRKSAIDNKEINFEAVGPIEMQYLLLESYDPTVNLVNDYIEMFVQWGYLCLFGAVCPIVFLLAFLTDYMETRTDGRKLLCEFRRVVPNRVDGIGEPLAVFEKIVTLAIPVNAGLVVYTFGAVDFLSGPAQMMVFLGIIAFLLLCANLIETSFPKLPEKTEIQLERQEVIYDRVVCENPLKDEVELQLSPDDLNKEVAVLKAEQAANKEQLTMAIVPVDDEPQAPPSRKKPNTALDTTPPYGTDTASTLPPRSSKGKEGRAPSGGSKF